MNCMSKFDDFDEWEDDMPEWNSDVTIFPKEKMEELSKVISSLTEKGGLVKTLADDLKEITDVLMSVMFDEIKKKELVIATLQFTTEHILRIVSGSIDNPVIDQQLLTGLDSEAKHVGYMNMSKKNIFLQGSYTESGTIEEYMNGKTSISWNPTDEMESKVVVTQILQSLLQTAQKAISDNDNDRGLVSERLKKALEEYNNGKK